MKTELRAQAVKLRRKGYSIKQIRHKLGVSQSSASLWCRGIELTPEQIEKLKKRERVHSAKVGLANRDRWDTRRQAFADTYVPPLTDPEFMLGLGLYWGEGTKSKTAFAITNCDPRILRAFLAWVRKFFADDVSEFSITVRHHDPHNDKKILAYWQRELALTDERVLPSQFHTSSYGKRRRGNTQPFGCVNIATRGQQWQARVKITKAMALYSAS